MEELVKEAVLRKRYFMVLKMKLSWASAFHCDG